MDKQIAQELIEAIIKKNHLELIKDVTAVFGVDKSELNREFLVPMAKAMFKTEQAIKIALNIK